MAAAGQFPPGSMGPKVEAALYFLERGGEEVVICHPEALLEAFDGRAGTRILKEDPMNTHRACPNSTRDRLATLSRPQPAARPATGRRAEIDTLLAVASRFEAADRAGRSTALLPDELAYALFFDNSTRTKSAWAGAASRLGMRPVIVDGSSTQVEHGETAEETGAMLGMNAHALGIRHDLILGAGNTLHALGQAGHRRLPRGHARPAQGAGREPAVRHRPPDADAGRPACGCARSFPGGLKGRKIAMTLGLLAELRQAAVGAAGPRHAA